MNELTKDKLVEYISGKRQATANDLSVFFNISRQAIHRQLKRLLEEKKIYKIGRPPKVFYLIAEEQRKDEENMVENETKKLIEENFLTISPSGEKLNGFQGFVFWCQKHDLPIEKTSKEYRQTIEKYAKYKKDGFIDGMHKMKMAFENVAVNKLIYLDFYSIERFGKTKLGQLLLYAKQSQSRDLINELISVIKPKIEEVIAKFNINAVGFIPPTVKREVQLMKEVEKRLNLSIPKINIVKIKTSVTVPQKTLNKLEDRIENAKNTIIVNDTKRYKNVLIVDDALGSGATINETAKKIRDQGTADFIVGLAITGSFSGFEVISEV